jgi:2-polyprenyl-3-methyl-5-hydroxy-6-metoxy-1,4-benzoquinol methylase
MIKLSMNQVLKVLKNHRVALYIIAYEAEDNIDQVLKRIPKNIVNRFSQIYLIDDSSKDKTVEKAVNSAKLLGITNFKAMKTPFNQGYGGNQKIGYNYAIKQGFEYVIMLHGDGQYPPESLPDIIECFADPQVAAVFGSRMINRYDALKGGMPLYKWVGNQLLTLVENKIMQSNLSEFHSGYRAYSVKALKLIPFLMNSDVFHFDTDIIIQFLANNFKIKEIPIPTHYGDEICRVNGLKYAKDCLISNFQFRLHKMGVLYQPNFDIQLPKERVYSFKKSHNSLHYYIINHLPWKKADVVVDLGANDGILASKIISKVKKITVVDIQKPWEKKNITSLRLDLNQDFDKSLGNKSFNKVIALDIIEHLNNPEAAIKKINNILKPGGTLYASTANIGYFIMRITHLIGWFNYGKRGILDMTHQRLFTVNSFKKLLQDNGFILKKIVGFGPPVADQISRRGVWKLIDVISGLLAKQYPPLFSFNFLIIAEKKTAFEDIYQQTFLSQKIS